MNKHTPKPWRYVGFGGTHILDPGGRCIADAPQPNGMDPEEGFANARLTASAPELLEALEALLEQADLGEVDEETKPIVEQARAAIRKAKGEA